MFKYRKKYPFKNIFPCLSIVLLPTLHKALYAHVEDPRKAHLGITLYVPMFKYRKGPD